MQVEERQVYHEKWSQRRKLRWMRPHRMRDSSLISFTGARCIYPTSHQRTKMAQGRVWGGSCRRAVAQRDRQFQKCLGPRRHSPFRGASGAGRKTQPLRRGLKPGGRPPEAEVMYPVVEHTRPNRAARNHSRSRAPHHRTQKNATQDKSRGVLYLSYVRIWHKAVFKVGPVAGP